MGAKWNMGQKMDMGPYLKQYGGGCDGMPSDGEQLYRAGAQLAGEGRHREALRVFACALKGNSHDPVLQAYFGLCLAAAEQKLGEGLKICENALEQHFYQSELYVVLARVYLIAGSRRKAFQTLIRGLKVDSASPLIHEELGRMDTRRRPIFPFLSRDNALNVVAGRMRHRLFPSA